MKFLTLYWAFPLKIFLNPSLHFSSSSFFTSTSSSTVKNNDILEIRFFIWPAGSIPYPLLKAVVSHWLGRIPLLGVDTSSKTEVRHIIRGRHQIVGPSFTAYARDNLGYVDAGTDDNTNTVLPSSHNTYCIPGPQSNKVRMPGTPSLLQPCVSFLGTVSSRLMTDLMQQEIRQYTAG